MQRYKATAEVERSKLAGRVSRQQLDDLVRQTVRYVIFRNAEREGAPISRADLTGFVTGKVAGGPKKTGLAS